MDRGDTTDGSVQIGAREDMLNIPVGRETSFGGLNLNRARVMFRLDS